MSFVYFSLSFLCFFPYPLSPSFVVRFSESFPISSCSFTHTFIISLPLSNCRSVARSCSFAHTHTRSSLLLSLSPESWRRRCLRPRWRRFAFWRKFAKVVRLPLSVSANTGRWWLPGRAPSTPWTRSRKTAILNKRQEGKIYTTRQKERNWHIST